MILLKNVQKIGTLGGPKVEKKVKCLTKWVRLAPIELKLCRNDQAMIRTSILLILANFSQFFEGKSRFFFFLSPLPPPELSIFPVFSHTNGWLPCGKAQKWKSGGLPDQTWAYPIQPGVTRSFVTPERLQNYPSTTPTSGK